MQSGQSSTWLPPYFCLRFLMDLEQVGTVPLWSCRGMRLSLLCISCGSSKDYSYLLNPYIIATCIAKSTTALDNLVVVGVIALAAHGEGKRCCQLTS